MILSGNELVALAAKAARGAGAPPQQAADFGAAAMRHFQAGRPPQHLRAALQDLPDGVILDLPLALTRIVEGAQGGQARGVVQSDAHTELVQSYLEAQPFAVTASATPAGLVAVCALETPAPRPAALRVTLPGGLARLMTDLAARLLVPDTAASRAGGAGAGLTDND